MVALSYLLIPKGSQTFKHHFSYQFLNLVLVNLNLVLNKTTDNKIMNTSFRDMSFHECSCRYKRKNKISLSFFHGKCKEKQISAIKI